MANEYTPQQIVEIKANSKASKLVLAHKKNPIHFNLLKSIIYKIEGMSGVEVKIPNDYKHKDS